MCCCTSTTRRVRLEAGRCGCYCQSRCMHCVATAARVGACLPGCDANTPPPALLVHCAALCCACRAGAELISVLNSDENKTFGVVFRTPVDNSYGIPHILEHSVLCGSRKYPIKVRRAVPRCDLEHPKHQTMVPAAPVRRMHAQLRQRQSAGLSRRADLQRPPGIRPCAARARRRGRTHASLLR